jgi:hypothetical protein
MTTPQPRADVAIEISDIAKAERVSADILRPKLFHRFPYIYEATDREVLELVDKIINEP